MSVFKNKQKEEFVPIKKRNFALDFVKFIATLLVLNSHMDICYGKYSIFATGGGIGDALFFFISGFTLFLGGSKMDFFNWYKRRISRIYPAVLAMGLFACTIFGKTFSFIEVLTVGNYWFLQCILFCYILLYPVIHYELRLTIITPTILASVIILFFLINFQGQLFYGVDNYFRWVFYFAIMIIGGTVFKFNDSIQYKRWHLFAVIICVFSWYGINFASRFYEYFSIFSIIPLIGICYFSYSIGKGAWVEKIFKKRISGNLLFIAGNLCLESYMIQKYIFTDKLNHIFPLNILIIIIAVSIAAYLLRVVSVVITQIFDSKPFDWKALLLYKNLD